MSNLVDPSSTSDPTEDSNIGRGELFKELSAALRWYQFGMVLLIMVFVGCGIAIFSDEYSQLFYISALFGWFGSALNAIGLWRCLRFPSNPTDGRWLGAAIGFSLLSMAVGIFRLINQEAIWQGNPGTVDDNYLYWATLLHWEIHFLEYMTLAGFLKRLAIDTNRSDLSGWAEFIKGIGAGVAMIIGAGVGLLVLLLIVVSIQMQTDPSAGAGYGILLGLMMIPAIFGMLVMLLVLPVLTLWLLVRLRKGLACASSTNG